MARKLSKLQQAYREFFLAKMEEFGVKSPVELRTDEKRKEFWNSIKKEWPAAKRAINEGVLRKEIRKAIAEVLEDMMPGGKGDDLTDQDVDPRELEIGIAVEKEHTNDPAKAHEIALDHLAENPRYYSDLLAYGMVDEPEAVNAAKRLGKKVGQTHSPTTHKGSATASKPVSRAYEAREPRIRKKIKTYKGKDIIDLGNDVIAVGNMKDDPLHDFIIDLDDSKMSGARRSLGMTRNQQIKAAHDYIDWLNRK